MTDPAILAHRIDMLNGLRGVYTASLLNPMSDEQREGFDCALRAAAEVAGVWDEWRERWPTDHPTGPSKVLVQTVDGQVRWSVNT